MREAYYRYIIVKILDFPFVVNFPVTQLSFAAVVMHNSNYWNQFFINSANRKVHRKPSVARPKLMHRPLIAWAFILQAIGVLHVSLGLAR